MLNKYPHCGSTTFYPVLASVSSNVGSWANAFLVVVRMTGSTLVEKSNCLAALGEDPSLTSAYFIFGALRERLVVGFLGGIFLHKEQNEIPTCRNDTEKQTIVTV
jgi:hypothetical protein